MRYDNREGNGIENRLVKHLKDCRNTALVLRSDLNKGPATSADIKRFYDAADIVWVDRKLLCSMEAWIRMDNEVLVTDSLDFAWRWIECYRSSQTSESRVKGEAPGVLISLSSNTAMNSLIELIDCSM